MSAGFAIAYDFQSTNENNEKIGTRPYVVQTDVGIGYVTLDFVNGYSNSLAYFEVRVDGVVKISGSPHPIVTDDFIYPGVHVDTRGTGQSLTVSGTYNANEYIEVRHALGGEDNWYFDWTRFDVGKPCATIQSGELLTSDGSIIDTGFDDWGYNYQARMFNGKYCDAYRDAAWCQDYKEDDLLMKWNDAWLSNKDCDGDGLLDRHFGFETYIGSGAWLTNHQKGVYYDDKGKKQRWTYFVKIVAAPADATSDGGTWYAADGTEIGPVIWGSFAIIQEVASDTGSGDNGIQYLSPYSAGFGKYSPE